MAVVNSVSLREQQLRIIIVSYTAKPYYYEIEHLNPASPPSKVKVHQTVVPPPHCPHCPHCPQCCETLLNK